MTDPHTSSHSPPRHARSHDLEALPENLEACLKSAKYWTYRLPQELHGTVRTMHLLSLLAAFFSAITAVGIWPLISQKSDLWAQSVTSAVTLAAAILAAWPAALGLREKHDTLVKVSRRMGRTYGDLLDAKYELLLGSTSYKKAHKAIDEFDELRGKLQEVGLKLAPADEEAWVKAGARSASDTFDELQEKLRKAGLKLVPADEKVPPKGSTEDASPPKPTHGDEDPLSS